MKLISLRTACLAAALCAGMTMGANADDTAIATVNGETITNAELDLALRDLEQQFARVPEDQRRAAALSALIEIRMMAQEAKKDGIDETDEYARQLRFVQDRVLHQTLIDQRVNQAITDDVLMERYTAEIASQPAENEVRARHILVKTKEEADEIIKQLADGADFETLASEKTTDPSGKNTGGDLGYFGRGMMVPPLEEAAFSLDPGAVTQEPVQTQFGFHVIKVEDRRSKQPPAFEQVKEQIRSIVIREKYIELANGLREKADVDVLDEDLKTVLEPENAQ